MAHTRFVKAVQGKNPADVSVNEVAEKLRIPKVYIWVLEKEGRFNGFNKTNKNQCKRCQGKLRETERDMCAGCIQRLSQIIENATADVARRNPVQASSNQPQASLAQNLKNNNRSVQQGWRYGFAGHSR